MYGPGQVATWHEAGNHETVDCRRRKHAREAQACHTTTVTARHGPKRLDANVDGCAEREARLEILGVGTHEIEDAMVPRIAPGHQRRPGNGGQRVRRRPEHGADSA